MPFLSSMRKHRAQRTGSAPFPTQEHVGRDVQRRRNRQGLVDGLDAGTSGVLRRLEVHLLAVQVDLSGVWDQGAGESLDQRRLAGTVVADHREDLARKQVDVHTVEADNPAEGLDQPTTREHRVLRVGEHRRVTETDGASLFVGQFTASGVAGHAFTFLIH